jgi:SAM-dependent methyltransferase
MMERGAAGAREAYDTFAAFYEAFNRGYMYERWTGRLLDKAEEAGLHGLRLLDVGCGTGLSFLPLLDRGWEVTGCDISPGMLEIAREKSGGRAQLHQADMAQLPAIGDFDLVWSVNDAVNYLGSNEELVSTLRGMKQNLSPQGVLLFDLNTADSFRTWMAEEVVVEDDERRFLWRGQTDPNTFRPGGFGEAICEVEGAPETRHFHRQRHFPEEEVLDALLAAGLHCWSVYGELDGELSQPLDEEDHSKAVFVAVRS